MSRNLITLLAARQGIIILNIGFLLLALVLSATVKAEESAGRLLFARGEVQIASVDAEPRAAKRGDVLHVGDTITTGSASTAQLRMSDGALIALKAGTIYRIEEQDYDSKAPGEGRQVGELLRGGLRAITGAIGHEKPEAVKYRTPVATIGVRGTVFDTIYIPPEGLPELPGMAPGTYVMVLEGQVVLSTATGELLLGPGEVGYVPFDGAPPELRPDLAPIFVEFASFEEKDKPKTTGGTDTYSRTILGIQQDTRSISTVLAEQLVGSSGPLVSPGPYGIANIGIGIASYQGDFFSSPVTVGSSGELESAAGGSGSMIDYQLNLINNGTLTTGSGIAGDSDVNWGQYGSFDVAMTDDGGGAIISSTDIVNYITATNVLVSIADLPTTGSYTYDFVDGVASLGGATETINMSSNLVVDFGTGLMDVTMSVGGYGGTWNANNQAINNFYGNGVSLYNSALTTGGSISGRFVGSGAEGAIAGFEVDTGDGVATGTGLFTR